MLVSLQSRASIAQMDHTDDSVLHQMIGDLQRKRLLVVDDEESMRVAISRFLRSRGYEVEVANSASDALAKLSANRFAAMICDIRMPGMTGVEMLPRALDQDPDLAVVMLTAVNDSHVAAQSLSRGAGEYLVKPVELGELHIALERVLNRRFITMERRNVERLIADEVDRRVESLARERDEMYSRCVASVALAVSIAESKDPFFVGTSARVAAVSSAIAEVLSLDAEVRRDIDTAAQLHDIGRLSIPDSIHHKREPLGDGELARIRDHVRMSVEVLSPLLFLGAVSEYVQDHHERWDGGGYPNNRSGERISIGGRVLGLADAFIALTSRRPYRDAVSAEEALAALASCAGSQFEPACLRALVSVVNERRILGLTAD
ncbi:MAG: response regulator [Gemmatimonadaceae bacterium]